LDPINRTHLSFTNNLRQRQWREGGWGGREVKREEEEEEEEEKEEEEEAAVLTLGHSSFAPELGRFVTYPIPFNSQVIST